MPPRFDITIAGEINLDLVLDGIAETMPVERELLASDCRLTLGSSSAILAHNLAALGAKTGFATLAGLDDFGRIALDYLSAQGVDLSAVRQGDDPTGITVLVNHGRSRHILSYAGAAAHLSAAHLDIDYLADARHFHLSSLYLLKALQPDLPALFAELKRRGLTLSLDTNDDPDDRWDGVLNEILPVLDVFLPNERELLRVTGESDLDAALDVIAGKTKLTVVKRGADGALARRGAARVLSPAMVVKPLDMVGAGDSFNAGFLLAHVRGLALDACLKAGNVMGAISTLRHGGVEAFRDRAFLKSAIADLAPDWELT